MIAHATVIKDQQPNGNCTDFFAHGMGLITHEAPFLMTDHPVAYEGTDAAKPLKSGMVLSIETTMLHPKRGFIKLEDTFLVQDRGCELFDREGRGWTGAAGGILLEAGRAVSLLCGMIKLLCFATSKPALRSLALL